MGDIFHHRIDGLLLLFVLSDKDKVLKFQRLQVVIGTIQLGATVDYAILMTTRYKRERFAGATKKEAITTALSTSIPSIIVSALGFFAATFGVGLISSVDMIGSLCSLMARGAIVSMIVVIFVLPSLFVLLDKIIIHTSMGFIDKSKKQA